jgi:hypothetical protein
LIVVNKTIANFDKKFLFQCHLNKAGASDLIVDLVIKNTNYKIFRETLELGIALLEGGNTVIQVSLALLIVLDYYLSESYTHQRLCYMNGGFIIEFYQL